MARKKDKIVVNLDLPKDDTTLTKLYVILFFSIILGLGSGLFGSPTPVRPHGQR